MDEGARRADSVGLVAEGGIAAAGPVAEILTRLDLRAHTGRFEAASLLETRVEAQDADYALTRLEHPAGSIEVPRLDLPAGAAVRLRIRARDVAIAVEPPRGLSIRNLLRGRVVELAHAEPAIVEARLDMAGSPLLARITRRSADELGLVPGREVWALVKSVALERRGAGAAAFSREDEAELPG